MKLTKLIILLLALGFIFAGCSEDEDEDAPTISTFATSSGSTSDVAVNSAINIYFNEDIGIFSESHITVTDSSGDTYTGTLSGSGTNFTWTGSSNFAHNRTITATVSYAEDKAANKLSGSSVLTFTTIKCTAESFCIYDNGATSETVLTEATSSSAPLSADPYTNYAIKTYEYVTELKLASGYSTSYGYEQELNWADSYQQVLYARFPYISDAAKTDSAVELTKGNSGLAQLLYSPAGTTDVYGAGSFLSSSSGEFYFNKMSTSSGNTIQANFDATMCKASNTALTAFDCTTTRKISGTFTITMGSDDTTAACSSTTPPTSAASPMLIDSGNSCVQSLPSGSGNRYYYYTFTPISTSKSFNMTVTANGDLVDWAIYSDSAYGTSVGTCAQDQYGGQENCTVSGLTIGKKYYLIVDHSSTSSTSLNISNN